jgi:hypothetical protein
MDSFYPKGALKGSKVLEALIEQRFQKPSVIYLISINLYIDDKVNAYTLHLDHNTYIIDARENHWHIVNDSGRGTLQFKVNQKTGYLESPLSGGYVFDNLWFAYAYLLHLKQSNYHFDSYFQLPIGLGT